MSATYTGVHDMTEHADTLRQAAETLAKQLREENRPEAAKRVEEASILLMATPSTAARLVALIRAE